MFDWLKKLFGVKKEQPEEVTLHFQLPNGNKLEVTAVRPLEYLPQEKKCKIHWDYNGVAAPTNNCNICWEYHASKRRR